MKLFVLIPAATFAAPVWPNYGWNGNSFGNVDKYAPVTKYELPPPIVLPAPVSEYRLANYNFNNHNFGNFYGGFRSPGTVRFKNSRVEIFRCVLLTIEISEIDNSHQGVQTRGFCCSRNILGTQTSSS